jgi:hypothetical protein
MTKDNCWICEGWSEHNFEIRTPTFGGNVNIHFLFENFKPNQCLQTEAGVYASYRMLPPGMHQYFYTVNGQYQINVRESLLILNGPHLEIVNKAIEEQGLKTTTSLLKINYVESIFHKTPWLHKTTYDILIKNCVPRPLNIIKSDERPRTPWTF